MSDHRGRLRAVERSYPPPCGSGAGPYVDKPPLPPEWWAAFARCLGEYVRGPADDDDAAGEWAHLQAGDPVGSPGAEPSELDAAWWAEYHRLWEELCGPDAGAPAILAESGDADDE